MSLAKRIFTDHLNEFKEQGVRILVSGVQDKLDKDLIGYIDLAQNRTKNNKKLIINFCFNYGGRREILEAVKRIIKDKKADSSINEKNFRKYLFNDLPDPDVIVRTSGEQRLSNFLTWQSVYSELVFIKKYWPAFTYNDLKRIKNIYKERQRRFGQ